jgi:signal transduction histidine kinase
MAKKTDRTEPGGQRPRLRGPKAFAALSQQILLQAGRGSTRLEFLREVARLILEFSNCDGIEFWLRENDRYFRCAGALDPASGPAPPAFEFETLPHLEADATGSVAVPQTPTPAERLCAAILEGALAPAPTVARGTFWIADTGLPVSFSRKGGQASCPEEVVVGGDYRSLAIIPLERAEGTEGLLQLKSRSAGFFNESAIQPHEQMATYLTLALVHQKTQAALAERVKELTCLYGITQVSDDPELQLDGILSRIVELLPPSWQYPAAASARITLDGKTYQAPGYGAARHSQSADIVVRGEARGVVEVIYTQEKPELDEGPFMREERGLLDAVASQISLVVERRRAEDERARLQEQLRHADRLATIGQLAAGVAHELNEPLGNILGFAQLARKSAGLPEQARQDIEKIIGACLHAREVIQKLMMFARQTPPKKMLVNLNQLVQEGLYFLEARCARQGVEVIRILDPDLPEITADSAQLHQVLVNLAVNAVQAMPAGGKLTLRTARSDDRISLVVEDTGTGMDEKVLKMIFMPFFTTKEVGQGLGLGLAVVHGIVSGHRGSIKVQSRPGEGSRFEVILPVSGPAEKEEVS